MNERASLLIVDDERGPAESLRIIFKPLYNVFTAPGGEQALQILHTTPIDVVTLDLRMPGMSGVEVMEHIKRLDPDIEVIVVTGYASLESAVTGLRHRIFDYVTKPFDVSPMCTLVERAVERRHTSLRARQLKNDFLANLSHELRTPLSAIIGYNSILTEELQSRLNTDQQLAFGRIQANSQQLLDLIDTVILLNSLDAGELQLSVSTFDVRETLRHAGQHFEPLAQQRGVVFSCLDSAEPTWVTTDEHKLRRILWALIDNAIKFTPHGEIALWARPAGDGVSVEIGVRDTGMGIEESLIPQLLEELPQSTPISNSPTHGLGLGLRTATRLTQFLGGQLAVRSALDRGTQVTISLLAHAEQSRRQLSHVA